MAMGGPAAHCGGRKIRARAVTAFAYVRDSERVSKFPAVNLWFDYPCHRVDGVGI